MKYLISDINEFNDDEIKSFVAHIKEPKLAKIRLMSEKRYKQSIIGEILLSRLLKSVDIAYSDVEIEYNENGKPFIVNYPMYYNISHDYDKVICAINDSPIGVDILKNRTLKKGFWSAFCCKEEIKYFKNHSLIELFTLKEAYIKCIGLQINKIKEFSVVNKGKIILENGYKYESFINDDYYISICIKEEY